MGLFKPDGVVMMIVKLVLELEAAKKRIKTLESDRECLERLLQTKQKFEVKV